MGEVDIAVLHPIYRNCINLNKEFGWNFSFKEDSGDFETMLEFFETRVMYPPISKDWDESKKVESIMICPDILDFHNKILIEYEEQSKPQKGPKIRKKGHWAESKRDSRRDGLYKKFNFRFCKIWEQESQEVRDEKLKWFLTDCFTKRDQIMQIYLDVYLSKIDLLKARLKKINDLVKKK